MELIVLFGFALIVIVCISRSKGQYDDPEWIDEDLSLDEDEDAR